MRSCWGVTFSESEQFCSLERIKYWKNTWEEEKYWNMRQRFILVALSCSLRIHSADKISRKNLVLSEKSRPTLVKELKYEQKKGGAVKHGHFTGIGTGALFKRRRYFGGRKYMKRQRTRKKIKKRSGCSRNWFPYILFSDAWKWPNHHGHWDGPALWRLCCRSDAWQLRFLVLKTFIWICSGVLVDILDPKGQYGYMGTRTGSIRSFVWSLF